jgi:hypothetical protein
MTDTFITEYYFWVAIPAQILGFILLHGYSHITGVYVKARHLNDYLKQQAVVMLCAWIWPFTFILVAIFIVGAITYVVLAGIGLVVTWLADKTIGKLMKEKE